MGRGKRGEEEAYHRPTKFLLARDKLPVKVEGHDKLPANEMIDVSPPATVDGQGKRKRTCTDPRERASTYQTPL